MYPSLTDYISSIELAQDTLATLNYLRPVRKPNGQPFFSSGNFAVVFKMEDTRTGEHIALKCFLRDVPDRARRLRLIAEYIQDNPSPYLVSMTYLTDELWVDCRHCDSQEFDVVLMPWVEGMTLGEYVRHQIQADNRDDIELLTRRFDRMAFWLLEQSFAHGDLKPDNILINSNKQILLVDYDGSFVPTLIGETATEIGTLPYRHPQRTTANFDQHIDDFALLVLSLELHVLIENSDLCLTAESLVLTTEAILQPLEYAIWQELNNLTVKVSVRAELLKDILTKKWGIVVDLKSKLTEDIVSSSELIPYLKENMWGFCDQKKRIIIPCNYENAEPFSNGIAKVSRNGKWGFINEINKIIIPIKYDFASIYSNGFINVKLNGKQGFLTKNNQIIISAIYEEVGFCSEDVIGIRKNGNYGFVNNIGKMIILPIYEHITAFSEGLSGVRQDGKSGFIDKTGKIIIPLIYSNVSPFSEGLARVQKREKKGLIDKIVKVTLGQGYANQLTIYQSGFVDKTGKVVIPLIYDDAESFREGLARVRYKGKWGLIDKIGRVVVPFIYDEVGLFSEGLSRVMKNTKCGFINKKGDVIISLIYNDVCAFSEGLASVGKDRKWGFIDKTNQVIIPLIYGYTTSFSEGLARVVQNGKWLFIDKVNNIVIPPRYDEAWSFSEGLAYVLIPSNYYDDPTSDDKSLGQDKTWAYIDHLGNEFWELEQKLEEDLDYEEEWKDQQERDEDEDDDEYWID